MDWIQYIKRNEDQALKEIYFRFKDPCTRWIESHFNCDRDEAEEIFQLSVVILYDNIVSGKLTILSSDLQFYLNGIAKNKAFELIRKKQNTISLDDSLVLFHYVNEDPDSEYEDQLQLASQALEALGEPCKSLLELYYYNELNMEEIASQLGYKNSDTAKNQKYKCLKRLQNAFFNHTHNKL
jgi:RNA polymerase sigma-70 factor (ECF subfamily)